MNLLTSLKDFKYKKNLSNKELAKSLNISQTHLSLVMNGKRKPSSSLLKRIIIFSKGQVDTNTFFKDTFDKIKLNQGEK